MKKKTRFKRRAHSACCVDLKKSWNVFFILLFVVRRFFFLQLFYIVAFFCVSTVIKMCWRKSQWSICRFIYFLYILVAQHDRSNFCWRKNTLRKRGPNECSNWTLYEKTQEWEKKNIKMKQKKKIFSIFFSLLSVSHLTSACARQCVPFHLLHVFAIMCSRESFRSCARITSMFIFCGCIVWTLASINNKRKNWIDTQFEVKIVKRRKKKTTNTNAKQYSTRL